MTVRIPLVAIGGRTKELPAADSLSIPWSWITSPPTTLSGYGISDALHKTGAVAESIDGLKTFTDMVTVGVNAEGLRLGAAGAAQSHHAHDTNGWWGTNTYYNAGWAVDDATKPAFVLMQHIANDRWEFRHTPAGGSQSTVATLTGAGVFNAVGGLQSNGNTVWHAGNDGAGSGLDADLLDGQQGAFYQNANNISTGTLSDARLPSLMANKTFTGVTIVANFRAVISGGINYLQSGDDTHASGTWQDVVIGPYATTTAYLKITPTAAYVAGNAVWHAGNFDPADYPLLGGDGKIPTTYLPSSVLGQVAYQGTWNATTGAPTASPQKGWYYIVTVAGSTNLSGITDWKVGDWAVYNGAAWDKVDNTDAIASWNGRTGAVVPAANDYTFAQIGSKPTTLSGYGITDALPISGGTLVDALAIAPTDGTVNPLKINGSFTGNGRTVQWDNNDTSASSAMSLQMLSGATANMQVTLFGMEYAVTPALAGRTLLQNIAGSGVVISALVAGTDIQFWGASNTLLGKVGSGGDFWSYGTTFWGDDKACFQFSDTWLRLNPSNDFVSGIYGGSGLFRHDGPLQVGTTNANGFYVTPGAAPQWKGIELGYRKIPFTVQNANYTFVADDAGKGRKHTDTTARSYTVPANVFGDGDVQTVLNDTGTGAITLIQGAGVTMYLAGSSTTGNRTIAPRGMATIVWTSATVCYVSGPGVT